MIGELFIIEVLVFFFNLLLIFKKIPMFAIPLSIFSIYMAVMFFLPDTSYSVNQIFSFFILIVIICNLLVNAADAARK